MSHYSRATCNAFKKQDKARKFVNRACEGLRFGFWCNERQKYVEFLNKDAYSVLEEYKDWVYTFTSEGRLLRWFGLDAPEVTETRHFVRVRIPDWMKSSRGKTGHGMARGVAPDLEAPDYVWKRHSDRGICRYTSDFATITGSFPETSIMQLEKECRAWTASNCPGQVFPTSQAARMAAKEAAEAKNRP